MLYPPSPERPTLAAGWQDQALHDAVAVCGLFSLMNRLVKGPGITADLAGTGHSPAIPALP